MPMHAAGEKLKNQVLLKGATAPTFNLALINQQYSVVASTDVFTTNATHNLSPGDRVVLGPIMTGTARADTGPVNGQTFFVKTTPTATTFTLALTAGGATLDISSDGTGGWISREQGTMAVVNEVPTASGYSRVAFSTADWADDNLTQADSRFSAVEKSFGPFSSTVTITHVVRCTTATGAGVLYDSSPLSIVQPIGSGAYYRNTPRNTES